MEEGGVAKCPAGALFRVAPWAQQAAVSLNNPALVWPDRQYTAFQRNHHAVSATSIGFRFHRDLIVQSVSTDPKYSYTLIHWSRERWDSELPQKTLPVRIMFHIKSVFLKNIIQLWRTAQMYGKDTVSSIFMWVKLHWNFKACPKYCYTLMHCLSFKTAGGTEKA